VFNRICLADSKTLQNSHQSHCNKAFVIFSHLQRQWAKRFNARADTQT